MPPLTHGPRLRRVLAFGALAAASLGAAQSASAAPITYFANPANPAGPRVTLSSDAFAPGDKISVSGEGFLGSSGAAIGPYVALKLNDKALLGLTYGSDVAGMRVDESESPEDDIAVFDADGAGHFEGWVKLPTSLPNAGPGTGANAGQHWLRVLAGAFPSSNPTSQVSSFQAFFKQVDRVQLGFTNTVSTFFPGTTVPTGGGALTAKGTGFGSGEAVAVTLDGNPVTATGTTAAADGTFTATVTIPNPTTAGDHTLRFAGASLTQDVTIKAVAHSATLLTPSVRPGSQIAVDVTGYVGVSGAGQKVALNLAGTVIACGETDATGSAHLVGTVPAATTVGAKALNVLAGVKCLAPPVTDPFPRPFSVAGGVTVSATAPQLTSTFVRATVGTALPVSVAGFGAGETITAKLDGTTIPGTLTAGGDGAASGNVTIPAATALGDRVLTLHSTTSVAALKFTAAAAPTTTVTPTEPVLAGSTLSFALAGFVRGDGTAGQKIGVKVDAGDIISCVTANATGDAEGSIILPSDLAVGEHTLRFLTGTSCVSGGAQNDLPGRSIAVAFTVKAAPVVETPKTDQPKTDPPVVMPPVVVAPIVDVQAPTKIKSLKGGKEIELTIDAGEAAKVKVSVKTSAKVKLTSKAKAKVATIAKVKTVRPTTGKTRTVKLTLTADGKALLKKLGKLKVTVTITPDGAGTATTRTFTLRKP